MLPLKKLKELKQELDNCNNPLFIYDKDADGLSSFLLFYKYKKAGHGMVLSVKLSDAAFEEGFVRRIKSYEPDKIFILDVPVVPADFVSEFNVPVIHVDHHLGGEQIPGMKEFNPRDYDKEDASCTSSICYSTVKQNLWIAATGTVADWQLNKVTTAFSKKYPKLLSPKIKKQGEAMFESKIGQLGTIFNFILKGKTERINETVDYLKKVNSPEEILEQTTENGKKVYKQYNKLYSEYKKLLDEAESLVTKEKLFVFMYHAPKHEDGEMSFTAELSNELLYKYPKKVLVIAREKNGEMKCSTRSGSVEIRTKVLEAIKGLNARGGGHPRACGVGIKKEDFDTFIERLRELL